MDESDDPYAILGVPPTATQHEIRAAYRKLALRHHPDKAQPHEREAANLMFSRIGNAYEILSDEEQRREYDYGRQYGGGRRRGGQDPTAAGGWTDPTGFAPDPFSGGGHVPFDFFHRHHFHDPFQVFEQVFREEFGGGPPGMRGSGRSSIFDSFFGGPPGMGMGMGMQDPFFSDPFFGGRGGGPFGGSSNDVMDPFNRGSLFGGNGFGFGGMMNGGGGGNPGFTSSTYTVSSSTMSYGGRGGGESVTTQTTRKLVNGREEVVSERITRRADGTVTREVLDANGQVVPQLENQDAQAARSRRRLTQERGQEEASGAHGDDRGNKHSRRDSKAGAHKRQRKKDP